MRAGLLVAAILFWGYIRSVRRLILAGAFTRPPGDAIGTLIAFAVLGFWIWYIARGFFSGHWIDAGLASILVAEVTLSGMAQAQGAPGRRSGHLGRLRGADHLDCVGAAVAFGADVADGLEVGQGVADGGAGEAAAGGEGGLGGGVGGGGGEFGEDGGGGGAAGEGAGGEVGVVVAEPLGGAEGVVLGVEVFEPAGPFAGVCPYFEAGRSGLSAVSCQPWSDG
jgi:hypothetical protein